VNDTTGGLVEASDQAWLDRFAADHGRPLRVLHVGNIANNAYLNGKFLRRAGIDCHVMSYDYYDPMATPEWEGDKPRPAWFVQGPSRMCIAYLLAFTEGNTWSARGRRIQMAVARKLLAPVALRQGRWRLHQLAVLWYLRFRRSVRILLSRTYWLVSWVSNWWMRVFGLRIRSMFRRLSQGGFAAASLASVSAIGSRSRSQEIVDEFDVSFAGRADRLIIDEVKEWLWRVEEWQRLFARYDVVQCYATDPIRALVAGKRPYVAFEHGTLRDFTLGDDPLHRLNALAYRSADHVFITNGDCLAYAERLGVERYTPMVHPVDVEQHSRERPERTTHIRASLGAEVLLLCPLRHDWAIKGTDVHLRALPALVERHGPGTVLALCEWGAEVSRSAKLIAELGCAENVRWLPPLDRLALVDHIKASDVVLDQMALPHFGATAPQALAAGRPVVMSYDPSSTAWIAAEPAPILSAFDPAGVELAVDRALDPYWLSAFRVEAAEWIERYHHPRRIVGGHCSVYRAILGGT
jgi:hypothetical protein